MLRAAHHHVPFLVVLGLPALAMAVDGDLDPAFGENGKFLQAFLGSAPAHAVAALPDGRLYLGGHYDAGSETRLQVLRLLPDGSYDESFSNDGIFQLEVDLGTHSRASVLGVHPLADGRVLLSGYAADETSRDTPLLARLLGNGAPDPTFAPGGVRIFPLPGELLQVEDSAPTPEGGVLFTGRCSNCDGGRVFLARTTAAGDLDPSFGSAGWAFFDGDAGESHFDLELAVDAAGRPVVAGRLGSGVHELFVARLTALGMLDGSFDGDGVTYVDFPAYRLPGELAVDPVDGRIFIAAGSLDPPTPSAGVIALTGAGKLDGSFGLAGVAALTLEEGTRLEAILLQSDGRIVTAGSIDANGSNRGGFFLARLTPQGGLDATFHHNGVVRYEFDRAPDGFDSALSLALSAGRIIAAGRADESDGDAAVAALRLESSLVFADGFERGTTAGWESL